VRRFAMTLMIGMAAAAAFASTAQAAPAIGISPAKSCYLAGEKVILIGGGFTANGAVDIGFDGATINGGPFGTDGVGAFGIEFTFGTMHGVKSHTLTGTDTTNPAVTASKSVRGTTFNVSVTPAHATAGTPRRIKGTGFFAKRKVYMHVRRGNYKTDTKIAKAKGPCGKFSTRRTIVPLGVSDGKYKVQFDGKRHYSKQTRPRVSGTLTVSHN
jgi:hypothetical protein